MLELWPQQRPALQENLLAMRILLRKNYQPYAELLPASCRPTLDWLNRDLVPTMILLPNADCIDEESCNLALALEISFLAGRVHDLTAQAREHKKTAAQPEATSRAILVGDYLYTSAAIMMARGGYNQWLGRIGHLLCRRSEGKLARLSWQSRSYVPDVERVTNLHKENAEGLALAAELAVAKLDWPQAEKQAWTEFGFYIGLAQGILLYEQEHTMPALAEAILQAGNSLCNVPKLQRAAQDMILNHLQQEQNAASNTNYINKEKAFGIINY